MFTSGTPDNVLYTRSMVARLLLASLHRHDITTQVPVACLVARSTYSSERSYVLRMFITARSELRKVLFLAPPVCAFCLCMKNLWNW